MLGGYISFLARKITPIKSKITFYISFVIFRSMSFQLIHESRHFLYKSICSSFANSIALSWFKCSVKSQFSEKNEMDMKQFIRQAFNGQTRLVFSSKYKYFYIQSELQRRKKYKGNLLS